jgi:Flp pilus assembly protein TadG
MMDNYKISFVQNLKNPQRGVAAVEFAIVLIPLLLITAGIVEFGRVFWYYDALSKAGRDGARYLSRSTLLNETTTRTTARTIVNNTLVKANVNVEDFVSNDDIVISCIPVTPTPCTNPTFVTVSVNYSISVGTWIPFVSGTENFTVSLSPSTTMRYLPETGM